MIVRSRSWKTDGHRPDRSTVDRDRSSVGLGGRLFRLGHHPVQRTHRGVTGHAAQLSLSSLERDLPQDKWLHLAFHALPDGSMAFRDSFAPSFGPRYFPVMRGRIALNVRRHEVRVIGQCSWFVAILSLLLLPLAAMRPMAAPLLLALPLFLASYLIQKRRYAAIAEALRMQLKAEFPK
ncbi:hypothetical protein [Stenotrophomonas maltophilia]|uniref:hypothetical protein n=1 Tax=Stenotrophomonas maltophilia TaxID=40324 RepID=UPI0022F3B404|nr:hypothetical protein [Stenotrophomonas maltophilia]MDA5342791.1 hypothetical protein [Stenotrophomonas maltophilia]